jgi:hypothetical protein
VEDILGELRLHSLAWASDVLDFKFFGVVESSLSRSEVRDRWRNAPDRAEAKGFELIEWPITSREECLKLLNSIRDCNTDWSPEAIFCTVRSLLTLRRVSAEEFAEWVHRI